MSPTLPMPLCSTDFFGFSHRPFRGTPDLEDYVAIDAIDQEVQRLAAAAAHGDGIAVLTAVPGSGKTLVCQRLKAELRDRFEAVLLSSSGFATRRALLQAVLFALGQSYESSSEQELRLSVLNFARTLAESREGIVLIIDEAHLLNVRLLEELRCLTNHSQGGQPLIRVVLCGQLPLEDALVDPALEALNYRITCHATLEPLSMQESAQLIAGRLRRAGRSVEEVFTPEALETICRVSDGNPRCVVQLCDESLRMAAGCSQAPVEVQTVRQALHELKQLPLQWNESATDQPQTAADMTHAADAAADEWAPAKSVHDSHATPGRRSAAVEVSASESSALDGPVAEAEVTHDRDLGWSAAVSSVELGADCDLCESPPSTAGWSSFEPQGGWEPSGAAETSRQGDDSAAAGSSCGFGDGMPSPAPLPGAADTSWSDPMIDRIVENGQNGERETGPRVVESPAAADSHSRGFDEFPVEDVYAALDAQNSRTPTVCESGAFDQLLRSAASTAAGGPRRSVREPITDAEPSGQYDFDDLDDLDDLVADERDESGASQVDPVQRLDAVMAALSAASDESAAEPPSTPRQWQSAGDCRGYDVLEPGGEPQWDQSSSSSPAEVSAAQAGTQPRVTANRSEPPHTGDEGSAHAPVRRPYARLFSRVRRQQS